MNGQRTSRRGRARWPPCLVFLCAGCDLFTALAGGEGLPCENDQACPPRMVCEQGVCRGAVDHPPVSDAADLDAGEGDREPADRLLLDAATGHDVLDDAGQASDAIADGSADRQGQVEILEFRAEPASIEWGSQTILHVLAANATSCQLDGFGVCTAEQCETGVYLGKLPLATHTYELVCEGPGGPVSAELDVQVTCSSQAILSGSSVAVTSIEVLLFRFANTDGCFVIDGDLIIADSTDIVDLAPLAGLVEVRGDFEIYNNSGLTSLDGLQSLQRVTVDLRVGMWVNSTDGHQGNRELASIAGLSGLHEVGGNLEIDDYQTPPDSPLTSLHGLEELRHVGGYLIVQFHERLADVRGLKRLTEVGANAMRQNRYLWLDDLPALASLDGLQGLRRIDGSLGLVKLPALTSLMPLSALTQATGLFVVECDGLRDLTGLGAIRGMDGSLEITNNDNLRDLSSLEPALTSSLQGIHIANNLRLSTIGLLSQVTTVQAAEPVLCTTPLEWHMAALYGLVAIRHNPALVDVGGLAGLSSVQCGLYIDNNDHLTTLAPLHGVDKVGGELLITRNDLLAALGLASDCQFGGPDFAVTDNPLLPTSEAQALAAAWTAASPSAYHVTISGNAP